MPVPSNSAQSKRSLFAGRRGRQGGFTYIGILVAVALMGVALAAVGEVWHVAMKREKEQELLFIGNQFRQAITSYYEHSPPQGKRYPASLEDMLKDQRKTATQRHLRKIYTDPVNGSTEWGLIKGPDGEIFGIYSLSDDEPHKKNDFEPLNRNFEGKMKYSDWVFMHSPGQYSVAPKRSTY